MLPPDVESPPWETSAVKTVTAGGGELVHDGAVPREAHRDDAKLATNALRRTRRARLGPMASEAW